METDGRGMTAKPFWTLSYPYSVQGVATKSLLNFDGQNSHSPNDERSETAESVKFAAQRVLPLSAHLLDKRTLPADKSKK